MLARLLQKLEEKRQEISSEDSDDFLPDPNSIYSIYGISQISNILNSITNSSYYECFTVDDEAIAYAFEEGMRHKMIISLLVSRSYKVSDNLTRLYEILIGIFLRGIEKYKEHILIYILYLVNMSKFRRKTARITFKETSFYEFVKKTDYNYCQYYDYIQDALHRKRQDIRFTTAIPTKLLNIVWSR